MRIAIRLRSGEIVERNVEVGAKLTGLRLDSVLIDNRLELKKMISTEEGRAWMARTLLPAMT